LRNASSAIFRRQSRHKQSSLTTGMGRRTVSSAHQQVPDRLQVNSVPQAEQAIRRGSWFPNRFVMVPADALRSFSCRVHVERGYTS
jgi:hypothetical protein